MKSLLQNFDFGNEAADDVSSEELMSYFHEQDSFKKYLDSKNRLLVATARKGVGKSALMNWIAFTLNKEEGPLVVRCRGAELVRSRFNIKSIPTTPNEFIMDWMIRLCAVVNRKLAIDLKIANTSDEIALVEAAELDNFKERNLAGFLADRFSALFMVGKIPKTEGINEFEILKRLAKREIWIIIDDLDATYQKRDLESLELATFFSACRYLIQDVKGLSIRASIRTDVWAVIRRFDESLDKMVQYVEELLWSQRDFLHLLAKRVSFNLDRIGQHPGSFPAYVPVDDAEERLLESILAKNMEWGGREVGTYKVLYTLSYERPRWAIQLLKLAQESARRHRHDKIGKEHIDEIWGGYGVQRIADLVAEHKHQCPQVEELLNGFRGADRLMSRGELFKWINDRITNHIAASIEGKITRAPMEIAAFLYRIGFILARSEDKEGTYEHYRFDQMPDFLAVRTDDDFGLGWEIHPCYREALDIKKLNLSHRERFIRQRKIR